MTLWKKFSLNGLVPLSLAIVMFSVIIVSMLHIQTSTKDDMNTLLRAEQLKGSFVALQESLSNYSFFHTIKNESEIIDNSQLITSLMASLKPAMGDPEAKRYFNRMELKYAELLEAISSIISSNNSLESKRQSARISGVLNDLENLKAVLQFHYELKNKLLLAQIQTIIVFAICGSIVIITLSSLVSRRIYRNVSASIDNILHAMKQVETGNLSIEAPILSDDEIGRLTRHFNSMICERREAEQKITYMAYHDQLTNLTNRYYFFDQLKLAMIDASNTNQLVGIVYFDLDYFKKINDSLGHTFGDLVLQHVAKRLTESLDSRTIVSRVGGDEFMAIIPHSNQSEISEVVHALLLEIKKPLILQGIVIHLSSSIGVAIFPIDGHDAETLIKNADIALFKAKECGRASIKFFNPAFTHEVFDDLVLENELHRALAANELILYYQPQFNTRTKKLSGFEALVRWQHPERGMIPPGKFIPIAEETDIITQIGAWVLLEACTQMKRWLDQGVVQDIKISVNLSARQFLHQNIAGEIKKVLQQTQLDPRYLEIEITESMAMNVDHAISTMNDLKDIGVRIAIDDFGTGYSSLLYLKKFPIDRLKIDRSFVRDLTIDSNDKAIVSTILSMAKNLELLVTAEGVEHGEQFAFLSEHDCEEVQGFFFSRPLPSHEIESFLLNGEHAY